MDPLDREPMEHTLMPLINSSIYRLLHGLDEETKVANGWKYGESNMPKQATQTTR
jgi:hypothetical protein